MHKNKKTPIQCTFGIKMWVYMHPLNLEINMYARWCVVIFGEMKCVHKSMKMLKCRLHHFNCVLVDHNSACVWGGQGEEKWWHMYITLCIMTTTHVTWWNGVMGLYVLVTIVPTKHASHGLVFSLRMYMYM